MGERNPYLRNLERVRDFEPKERNLNQLLDDMRNTAFQGRALGDVYSVVLRMLKEKNNLIYSGYSRLSGYRWNLEDY